MQTPRLTDGGLKATPDPFSTAKEIHVSGSSTGFATEDELPPDPEIRTRVVGPAFGLIVVGICGLLLRLANSVRLLFDLPLPEGVATVRTLLWPGEGHATKYFVVMSAALILGGYRMFKLQSYWLSVGTSVLAMVPGVSPCCSVGVPVGLWSLAVLWNENVKQAFRD